MGSGEQPRNGGLTVSVTKRLNFADNPKSGMRVYAYREHDGRFTIDMRHMTEEEAQRVLASLRGGSHFGREHPAAKVEMP
jgi:hypothetical protein